MLRDRQDRAEGSVSTEGKEGGKTFVRKVRIDIHRYFVKPTLGILAFFVRSTFRLSVLTYGTCLKDRKISPYMYSTHSSTRTPFC